MRRKISLFGERDVAESKGIAKSLVGNALVSELDKHTRYR